MAPDALVRAIRAVHDGNMLLAPGAAGSLVPSGGAAPAPGGWFAGRPPGWDGLGALTAREREVLGELARGLSNRARVVDGVGVDDDWVRGRGRPACPRQYLT